LNTLSQVAARFRLPLLAEIAQNDPRFGQVKYVMEADAFTYDALKEKWCEALSWQCEESGPLVGLGQLIGHNLAVETRFAHLSGHMVLFYTPKGNLIDRNKVEDFAAAVCTISSLARPGSQVASLCQAGKFQHFVCQCAGAC